MERRLGKGSVVVEPYLTFPGLDDYVKRGGGKKGGGIRHFSI